MKVNIEKVVESDFTKLNYPILFSNELTDRVFGIVSNGVISYKFAWQSEQLNPSIINLKDFIYLIGIDQNLVIFDFNSGQLILKILLDYFFYDAKIYGDFIYVITELEVIKIDLKSFEIVEKYGLPEYFEGIEFKDGGAEIKCLGNNLIIIP